MTFYHLIQFDFCFDIFAFTFVVIAITNHNPHINRNNKLTFMNIQIETKSCNKLQIIKVKQGNKKARRIQQKNPSSDIYVSSYPSSDI